MNFFKRQWRNFVEYFVDNKKTIIINYLVFLGVFVIFILIDQLTKTFLYDNADDKQLVVTYQNALFGIRSVANYGLTFTGNGSINIGLVTFLNIIILLACLIFVMFLHSYWFAIFIGLIFTGSLGNTIDRLSFGYVKDIIFLPWLDRGTFNFADVDVIVGCIGIVFTMITIYLVKSKRN